MSKNNGGPAFPSLQFVPEEVRAQSLAHGIPMPQYTAIGGMSLRDYFATHAPPEEIDALLKMGAGPSVFACRYKWADALLVEREK